MPFNRISVSLKFPYKMTYRQNMKVALTYRVILNWIPTILALKLFTSSFRSFQNRTEILLPLKISLGLNFIPIHKYSDSNCMNCSYIFIINISNNMDKKGCGFCSMTHKVKSFSVP